MQTTWKEKVHPSSLHGKIDKPPPPPHDRYYTPPWVVGQCIAEVLPVLGFDVHALEELHILGPSAGRGAFALPLVHLGADVTCVDNDPEAAVYVLGQRQTGDRLSYHVGDFLTAQRYPLDDIADFDLTLDNPPFKLARKFVSRALVYSEHVVYLLRQGFLSSAKRSKWLREEETPSNVFLLTNRPGFTAPPSYVAEWGELGNSDKADYAFVHWQRGGPPFGETRLHWLSDVPAEERRKR